MNRFWEIEFIEEAPKSVLNVSIPITLKNYFTPKKYSIHAYLVPN